MRTDSTADLIDVRDVIKRYEELESIEVIDRDDDDQQELDTLGALLEDLRGNGGDEKWQGDWYPVTLIRDSYFTTYAQELAEDTGAINPDAAWPANRIDWEAAAEDLSIDYTSIEYDGITFWYR